MYRDHETSAKKGSVSTTQLVLPKNLREGVMEVAHDSILGGHLDGKKTLDRVTSNFHWLESQAMCKDMYNRATSANERSRKGEM